MWNIAISIVTPIHKKTVALFHNKDVPDCGNSGKWRRLHGQGWVDEFQFITLLRGGFSSYLEVSTGIQL